MKLGNAVTVIHGKNQKAVEDPEGKYPIYGSGGIMGYANSFICPADTVIIGRKGNINNPIYVREPFWNVDTAFGLVADRPLLNPRYLYHFCEFFDFERLNTTCTIPSLTRKNVEAIDINPPSLDSQDRICFELDACLTMIERHEETLSKLDNLVKSQFVEMFEGEKCFESVSVGDVFKTSSGGTPSSKRREYYEGGTIPWLTSGEVAQDKIVCTKGFITESGLRNSSAKWVPKDCVVVAMYGATAGKSGLLAVPATTNQAVCAIWPNDRFVPEYLLHAVRRKEQWMINQTAGGAQPNISQAIIRNMRLPIPPLTLQQEFAAFVQQVDKLKFAVRQSIDKLQMLYDSLAQEYFSVDEVQS